MGDAGGVGVKPLSVWRILGVTAAFAGCQMAWAVQIGFTTPELRKLGMSKTWVGYAWLAGPISGMVAQPVVGVWSDHCHSCLGRRRPFILSCGLFIILALILFSNAASLGRLLGDITGQDTSRGLTLAIVAFWILDFSINGVQGLMRALLADTTPMHQHALGNSLFSLHNGIGKGLGYLLGSLDLPATLPFFPTQIQALYSISAILIAVAVTCTLLCSQTEVASLSVIGNRARPPAFSCCGGGYQSSSSGGHCCSCCSVLCSSFRAVKDMPVAMTRAFWVQFMSYFGWFCTFVYFTDWVGESVYNGRPSPQGSQQEQDLYEEGIRVANLGLCLMAISSSVLVLFHPWLFRRVGPKLLWSISLAVLGVSLILSIFMQSAPSKGVVLLYIALQGIPLAATFSIPWSIVTVCIAEEDAKGPEPEMELQSLAESALPSQSAVTAVEGIHAADSDDEESDDDPEEWLHPPTMTSAPGTVSDARRDSSSKRGILSAAFNMSQCWPEILVSLLCGPIVSLFGGNLTSALVTGGIVTLVGAAMVFYCKIPTILQGTPSTRPDGARLQLVEESSST